MESSAEVGATFFHSGCNILGLLANGLLLFLVLTKTPKCLRTYSILIFNFGIIDFFGCLAALFVQQRVIPVGTSLACISSGPCKYFGSKVCYISYSFMLHCYAHSLWSLLLSFHYRYRVLCSKSIAPQKVITVLLLFYSISLFQFVILCSSWDDPQEMEAIILQRFPLYETNGRAVMGNKNIFEWRVLFAILHMTVPVTPVYCCIIYLRRRIIKTLGVYNMSAPTKAMHTQLLKALIFQAMLPGLFLIGVITYVIGQTGILNHPLMEFLTFLIIGILPAISPLGSLVFVTPYYSWIKKNFFPKNGIKPDQRMGKGNYSKNISRFTENEM